jgi:hypothetical protein
MLPGGCCRAGKDDTSNVTGLLKDKQMRHTIHDFLIIGAGPAGLQLASSPYTFFLLNDDIELNRYRESLIHKII